MFLVRATCTATKRDVVAILNLSLLFILSQYYNITDCIFESKLIFEHFSYQCITANVVIYNFFWYSAQLKGEAESIPWT